MLLNSEKFITIVRQYIENNTKLAKVYSPDLPKEKTNIGCITMLGGDANNNMNGVGDIDITFRVLIRGTSSDSSTRKLADEVFNLLHLCRDIAVGKNKITQILATAIPTYVGKDENQNNLYNITFNAKLS